MDQRVLGSWVSRTYHAPIFHVGTLAQPQSPFLARGANLVTKSGWVSSGQVSRQGSYGEYRASKLIFNCLPSTRVSCYREVETLKFALCRNIFAVVLLLALIIQTFLLFSSVFDPPSLQETWDGLQTVVSKTTPILILSSLSW